jgi:hypothetical protein
VPTVAEIEERQCNQLHQSLETSEGARFPLLLSQQNIHLAFTLQM